LNLKHWANQAYRFDTGSMHQALRCKLGKHPPADVIEREMIVDRPSCGMVTADEAFDGARGGVKLEAKRVREGGASRSGDVQIQPETKESEVAVAKDLRHSPLNFDWGAFRFRLDFSKHPRVVVICRCPFHKKTCGLTNKFCQKQKIVKESGDVATNLEAAVVALKHWANQAYRFDKASLHEALRCKLGKHPPADVIEREMIADRPRWGTVMVDEFQTDSTPLGSVHARDAIKHAQTIGAAKVPACHPGGNEGIGGKRSRGTSSSSSSTSSNGSSTSSNSSDESSGDSRRSSNFTRPLQLGEERSACSDPSAASCSNSLGEVHHEKILPEGALPAHVSANRARLVQQDEEQRVCSRASIGAALGRQHTLEQEPPPEQLLAPNPVSPGIAEILNALECLGAVLDK